jgi:hypothetical protein
MTKTGDYTFRRLVIKCKSDITPVTCCRRMPDHVTSQWQTARGHY